MLTKNQLKYYSSLLQKKFRKSEKKFIVEGKRLVEEAVDGGFSVETVFFTEDFSAANKELISKIKKKDIRAETAKSAELKKLTDTKNPQGIAAVVLQPEELNFNSNAPVILALENISDPGNLGTLFRSAAWFGIYDILLCGKCAEVYNPKVVRASMGAVFYLNIRIENSFVDSLTEFKRNGYSILTADMNGENLFEYQFPEKFIITVANEAAGPTRELLSITDDKISVPLAGKGESLNAAVAGSIIMSVISQV